MVAATVLPSILREHAARPAGRICVRSASRLLLVAAALKGGESEYALLLRRTAQSLQRIWG
jgi:hypothetical protein